METPAKAEINTEPPITLRVVEQYTTGKSPERNEDALAMASDRLVLSDGATDKNGFKHEGKTGGELAAEAAITACLETDGYGRVLVDAATTAIHAQYEAFNEAALENSRSRYGATLVDARLIVEETGNPQLVVTMVGDSGARVTLHDGSQQLFYETKSIDRENGALRAAYIHEHPDDIEGGRAVIMPRLQDQHTLQNVPTVENAYGYGVIDGTYVPDEFIRVAKFSASDVQSIELFSDGYQAVPTETGVAAFEAALAHQNAIDPHRIGLGGYDPQTKTADDRTYVLATIDV